MAASMSRTTPGNHKVLLVTMLCIAAATFLPGSSASTPLVIQTCGRTSNQRLCVSLLESRNLTRSATTVRQLARIALVAASRSVRGAWLRTFNLSDGDRGTPADGLVTRCRALYADCIDATTDALSRVVQMPAYDGHVAHAVTVLRVFPAKCQRLFDARQIVSPLEEVNRDTEEKLGIASEIVHLLRHPALD